MASVKLDISHLNIKLLSAPASLKQYFIKQRSNQKFARFRGYYSYMYMLTDVIGIPHTTLPNTGNCAGPAVMILTIAAPCSVCHSVTRLGKTICDEQHKPPPLLQYFSFQLAPSVSPRRISKCESQIEDVNSIGLERM